MAETKYSNCGHVHPSLHVDGGVCFDCGGSGREADTWRGAR